MKRFLSALLAVIALPFAVEAQTGLSSVIFTNLNKNSFTVDLNPAINPTNRVRVNLLPTGDIVTYINNALSGVLNTNANWWKYDTNTGVLSPSIEPAFVAATNVLAYGLYAEREFMLVNQGAVALALGANDVPVAGRNTISVNGTTTTADDSLLNIDNGNGFGQLLILRNNSTNAPTFTMHQTQVQTLDATKTNRLKGDWIPQNRGESLWLWNDGFGFVEVDRTESITDFGSVTNIFQNIVVTNLTAYEITVTNVISHDRILINPTYITINGTNLATINPTDGYLPYRINTNTFGDSQFQQVNTTNTLSHGSIIGTNDSVFTTYSDGTAANPAFSFGGFANGYGLFRDVNGEPSISIAALDIARFSASGFRIPAGNSFDWSVGTPDMTPIKHGIYDGNGTPEGVLVANVGSLYLDYNGGGVWKKTSDSGGNTGWVELGTGGSGGSSLWTNLALAFQPDAQYTNYYFGADIFASGTNNGQNITLLGNRAAYQAIFDSATHDVFGDGFYPFRASVLQGASDVSAIGQNSLATSYLTNSADIHGWGNYALFGLSATNSSNIYGKGHSAGQGAIVTDSGNLFFDGNESGLSSYFTNSFDISAFSGAFKSAGFTNSQNIIGLLINAGGSNMFNGSSNLLVVGSGSTVPSGAVNGAYFGPNFTISLEGRTNRIGDNGTSLTRDNVAIGSGTYVPLAGGTMTGPLLVTAFTNSARTASTFVVSGADKSDASTATSAMLSATLSDETGSGAAVFGTSPTIFSSLVVTGGVYVAQLASNTTSDQILVDWNESQSGGHKRLSVTGFQSGSGAQVMTLTLSDKFGYYAIVGANNGNIGGEAYLSGNSKRIWISPLGLGSDASSLILGAANSSLTPTLVLGAESSGVAQLGADSASPINQMLKGPDGSGTDKSGGNLTLEGGQSTGTGRGGDRIDRTSLTSTTGSTANSYSTRLYESAKPVDLTESSATALATITCGTNNYVGATFTVTIYATDGTDVQSLTSQVRVDAVDKAGTVTAQATQTDNTAAVSAGTLTCAYTATASTTNVVLNANAVSSLTQTVLRAKWVATAINSNDPATVTPQ